MLRNSGVVKVTFAYNNGVDDDNDDDNNNDGINDNIMMVKIIIMIVIGIAFLERLSM